MDAEYYINKMMEYYGISTISELASIINISQPSISAWKTKGYIKAIKKRCKELGIYEEIFAKKEVPVISNDNLMDNDLQKQKEDSLSLEEVDSATYTLFKEAYEKAIRNDDLKGFRIHLLDY